MRGLSIKSLVSWCLYILLVPLAMLFNDTHVEFDGSFLQAFHTHELDVPRILYLVLPPMVE